MNTNLSHIKDEELKALIRKCKKKIFSLSAMSRDKNLASLIILTRDNPTFEDINDFYDNMVRAEKVEHDFLKQFVGGSERIKFF